VYAKRWIPQKVIATLIYYIYYVEFIRSFSPRPLSRKGRGELLGSTGDYSERWFSCLKPYISGLKIIKNGVLLGLISIYKHSLLTLYTLPYGEGGLIDKGLAT
jgi:hypothetical protein